MLNSSEDLPDCHYKTKPTLIRPATQTPTHSLYLSNLDDQKFLRFSIKYLYVFRTAIDGLSESLSRVLVDYYPLAGRVRKSVEGIEKLVVDCNGEGALFAEGFMDFTVDQFLKVSAKPNRSWRKLLYRVEGQGFLDIPPLVVQVTNLRCGGIILCTAINHCICDGIGTAQFLRAWAHSTTNPNLDLPIKPFHSRHLFKPGNPTRFVNSPHPGYHPSSGNEDPLPDIDVYNYLLSQPLVPTSITFSAADILRLKQQCVPSVKCTAFEALASHTWRSWVRSLDLSPSLNAKLLFSVNIRKKVTPELPAGYYGNGFILGCAQTTVRDLTTEGKNLYDAVKLVKEAKSNITGEYVRSLVDLMEDKRVKTDLSGATLVISQWAKLGLEDLAFGGESGKGVYMGSVTSDIYCLFLPVVGDTEAVRVLVSMPETAAEKFESYMMEFGVKGTDNSGDQVNGASNGFHHFT
ncbi:Alcohol acyltransferase 9 [Linum perenne]